MIPKIQEYAPHSTGRIWTKIWKSEKLHFSKCFFSNFYFSYSDPASGCSALCPEGLEIIRCCRPPFLKPKLHKESKNWFKTINFRRYPVMIFSKHCFWSTKIIKIIEHFVEFWIFMAIHMDKLDQFTKINCRTFRISWNITKMLKTEHF